MSLARHLLLFLLQVQVPHVSYSLVIAIYTHILVCTRYRIIVTVFGRISGYRIVSAGYMSEQLMSDYQYSMTDPPKTSVHMYFVYQQNL